MNWFLNNVLSIVDKKICKWIVYVGFLAFEVIDFTIALVAGMNFFSAFFTMLVYVGLCSAALIAWLKEKNEIIPFVLMAIVISSLPVTFSSTATFFASNDGLDIFFGIVTLAVGLLISTIVGFYIVGKFGCHIPNEKNVLTLLLVICEGLILVNVIIAIIYAAKIGNCGPVAIISTLGVPFLIAFALDFKPIEHKAVATTTTVVEEKPVEEAKEETEEKQTEEVEETQPETTEEK